MLQERLPAQPLPPLATLLGAGGDERILADCDSGLSRYGCSALPDAGVLELGSSTASTISPAGFAAAAQCRQQLGQALASGADAAMCYAAHAEDIRQRLQTLLALPAGTHLTLAASGTDAHLIATHWVAADCCITVAPEETGSGVPAALRGQHPSALTPSGQHVTAGSLLNPGYQPRLLTLPQSAPDGTLHAPETLAAACIQAVEQAACEGKRILLVITDVSKRGNIVPDVATALALQARWPQQVTLLVDACQSRLAPATVRAYLAAGCLVALTGSKFFAGPTFSAALLCPAAHPLLARETPLLEAHLAALAAYSSRMDWPQHYIPAQRALPAFANFGLLLRWQAALVAMAAFFTLPEQQLAAFLQQFSARVAAYFAAQSDPVFQPLPQAPLQRQGLPGAGTGWDTQPTIFPFLLYGVKERGKLRVFSGLQPIIAPLDREATRWHYQQLLTGTGRPETGGNASRIRFGQPVDCGLRNNIAVSALRLCVSAPMLVRACASPLAGEQVIAAALGALDALHQQILANPLAATENNTVTV